MSLLALKAADVSVPVTDMERLKSTKGTTLEGEKDRLREASREFEAFFMYQMLKTMRKTVPKGIQGDKQLFDNESSQEIYTDLFDMELSRKIATGRSGSIADILFRSMEPLVEAQFAEPQGKQSEGMAPLRKGDQEPIPLGNETIAVVSRRPVLRDLSETRRSGSASTKLTPDDRISARFGREIDAAARRHDIDPALIHSVIKAESNGDPNAVSTAGAKGLMQLIDSTAAQYEVDDVFSPRQNIEAGTEYLRSLIDRFGDLRLALAAYNAGPGNVEKHRGIPPFPETKAYVNRVMDSLAGMRGELHTADAKGAVGDGR